MDNPRYCQHCGAKLGKDAKFCQKCGRSVGEGVKKRNVGLGFFILSIVFSVIGVVILGPRPNSQSPEAAAAIILFFLAGIFYLSALVYFFKWLFKKNKYVFWILLGILILAPLSTVIYERSRTAYLAQIFEVQEIEAEVVYAKSIGDDLIQGRAVSGIDLHEGEMMEVRAVEKITTWPQVNEKVTKEYARLKDRKVKKEIEPYRVSVERWVTQVVTASAIKNPQALTREERNRWSNLPQMPEPGAFNVDNEHLAGILDELSSQVYALKRVGDNALVADNKDTMRRVAAYALTHSHVAESIAATSPNICSKKGCLSAVQTFIPAVHRTAYDYLAGSAPAKNNWDSTWTDAPEIIKTAGSPLGGTGITQGIVEPTVPPNPSTTIRRVTPFQWPWQRFQAAPSWDGTYQANANVSCDATASDFANSFADSAVGNFEVRGNKVQGGAYEIEIDSSGAAHYDLSAMGASGSVDYYFTQTADGGVSVSGNLNIYVAEEEASASCTGDFSGSRISL